MNEALAAINLSDAVEADIRNAVNAGKEATAHENPVPFAGGTSIGYILFDPVTGGGAYKIAGGSNGADVVIDVLDDVLNVLSIQADIADVLNQLSTAKVFTRFIAAVTKILTGLVFFIGMLSILFNENCTVADKQFLLLLHTLMTVLLLLFVQTATVIWLLGPITIFISALILGLAMSSAFARSEQATCEE